MILPPRFDDSCVLWFDFASVKNNTVYDQSGNDNHGTIYGAQHIGRFGLHGLHFDGVDDYVLIDDTGHTYTEMTAIVLVKPRNDTQMSCFFDKAKSEDKGWFKLMYNHPKYPKRYRFEVWDGTTTNYFNAPGTYEPNIPHVIAGVATNTYGKLYIDAELKVQQSKDVNLSNLDGVIYLAYTPEGDAYAPSNIYFVALYNRALSDAEIRELYYYLTKGIRSIVPSRFVARKVG